MAGRTREHGPGLRRLSFFSRCGWSPARPAGDPAKATAPRRRRSVIVRSVLDVAASQEAEIPAIGTLNEGALHAQLKNWYQRPGDRIERVVDGFVVDLVRRPAGRDPDRWLRTAAPQARAAHTAASGAPGRTAAARSPDHPALR